MAMTACADLGAAALFQLMQVQVGIVDGAATQIVTIFTAIAYMPGIGLALAGTTLVGQAIGAGDHGWAERLGNRIIAVVACYMGGIGLVIALTGNWLVPLFVNADDPRAAEVIALCASLLWLAAAYQFFDGVNFASAFCLRGAGDARSPGADRAGLRHAAVPAADALPDLRTRPGLDRRRAGTRSRRSRRLECDPRLRARDRHVAVAALEERRLEADPPLSYLTGWKAFRYT